jgi:integrase
MSTFHDATEERTATTPTATSIDPFTDSERHARDDAPDERAFQLLLEGAYELEDDCDQRLARTAILLCGRLGLRAGELAHLSRDWVDWRKSIITIPRHDHCSKGRGNDICGYCRGRAKEWAGCEPDRDLERAEARQWHPKTERAARDVPFSFDPRSSLALERFLDHYDGWPMSRQAVNRRIQDAAEAAAEVDPDGIYPHCLRAAAAEYHAARGLDVLPLQALMGWSDISTAQRYVALSGEHTARALHLVHSR